uniref:DNA-directed RNA polymerase n=1 Tax=Fritschiella tuberosa TaxID=56004 RepID=A0A6H1XED0_9CHLO|nr:beta subunit of RNA polymerase [Fritschiella tuberosa]
MSISNFLNILPIEYSLQTYHRSNQDTTLLHRPVVKEGDWVQAGDLISDSGSSIGGEFSIGQNLLIAYLPWEGYNYEDAILISERLVYDDLYTSIHIERYDISTEKTPYGNEIITKEILLLKDTTELEHLDENGVAKLGSWLKEGDILVGKITPTEPKKEVARYIQLYNDILGKKMDYSFRDTSLRVPRGLEAKVIRVQLFPETKNKRTKRRITEKKSLFKCKKIKGYKRRIEPSYLLNYYKGLQIKQKLFSRKASVDFKKSTNFLGKEPRNDGVLSLQHKKKPISFFLDKFFRLNIVQIRPEKSTHMTSFFQSIKTRFPRKIKFNKNLLIDKPIQMRQEKELSSFSSQIPVSAVNVRPLRSQRATSKYVRVVKQLEKGLDFSVRRSRLQNITYFAFRKSQIWDLQTREPAKTKKILVKTKQELGGKFSKSPRPAVALANSNICNILETAEEKIGEEKRRMPFLKKRLCRFFSRKRKNLVFSFLFSSNAFLATSRPLARVSKIWNILDVATKSLSEKTKLRKTGAKGDRKKNRKRREWRYILFSKRKAALFFTKAFSSFSKYGNLSQKSRVYQPKGSDSQFVSLNFKKSHFSQFDRPLAKAQNRNDLEQKKQKERKGKTARSLTRKSKDLREAKVGIRTRLEKRKPTSITSVHVYLAEKRKVQVGDKMAGRHGNKGIISQILPRQDMPYLPDGSPIDLALNPLGVPSRMNVGQIYECLLGLAGKNLGEQYRIKPFDESFGSEASRSFVFSKLYEARLKTGQSWLFQPVNPGKLKLFDGRTGNGYDQPITTGYSYMIKLVHLVDEKIHSRSSGPYSLITQQPLKGRSKHGGQRLGEMEVWAIEAYGAAFILLELLTIKSDDVTGRLTIWDYILYKKPLYIGTPASFKVLICELQALCLDIGIYKADPANTLKQINVSTMG